MNTTIYKLTNARGEVGVGTTYLTLPEALEQCRRDFNRVKHPEMQGKLAVFFHGPVQIEALEVCRGLYKDKKHEWINKLKADGVIVLEKIQKKTAKTKDKYTCACGSHIFKSQRPRHEKTQLHIAFLEGRLTYIIESNWYIQTKEEGKLATNTEINFIGRQPIVEGSFTAEYLKSKCILRNPHLNVPSTILDMSLC